jgi:hypothetical protein
MALSTLRALGWRPASTAAPVRAVEVAMVELELLDAELSDDELFVVRLEEVEERELPGVDPSDADADGARRSDRSRTEAFVT